MMGVNLGVIRKVALDCATGIIGTTFIFVTDRTKKGISGHVIVMTSAILKISPIGTARLQ
jgi:RNase P/RNase MRP subunit p29